MSPDKARHSAAARAGRSRLRLILIVLVLVLATGGVYTVRAISRAKQAKSGPTLLASQYWPVRRGPLVLSLLASGSVKSKQVTEIKNMVFGDVKITWIIDEGTIVKAGDKLAELESSMLQESTIRQQIDVARAKSEYEQTKQNLENQKSTNRSDILIAENKFQMAELDLDKYIKGDYQQKIREAESDIKLADAELKRAQERLEGTKMLLAKGYVNKGELEADTLSLTKCQIELEKSTNAKELLEKYEYKREVSRLETEKEGALEELNRTKKNAEIELTNLQTRVDSAKAELDLETYQLDRFEKQLKNTVIYAPQGGMVVYAKSDWDDESSRIRIGGSVHYQQRLIDLPDFSAWRIESRIHESMIQQVKNGQKVNITMDAFQGQPLSGSVEHISVLPDSSRWTMDTKEYIVAIAVTTTTLPLRPGMTAKTEILLDSLKDVLYVPVQAISTVDGKATCYVQTETGPVPRLIEVGMSNDRFAEIKSGLREGDRVMLTIENATGGSSGKEDENKSDETGEKGKKNKGEGGKKTEKAQGKGKNEDNPPKGEKAPAAESRGAAAAQSTSQTLSAARDANARKSGPPEAT